MWRRVSLSLGVLILLLSGCVISPRRDVSSGGGGGGGGTPTGKLYVTVDSGNAIVRFDNAFTANGNIAPAATVSGPDTQLASPQFIALDQQADRLFVAGNNASAVLIFDAVSTKTGNSAPNRRIAGSATSLTNPTDLSFDKGRELLYVVQGTTVLVFSSASTTNGNVAPARTITPNPAFNIGGIFVDAANNRLFLSDPADPTLGADAVRVFDRADTLTGNVAPSRTITGSATQLGQPGGLIVDSAGRLIVSNFAPARITIYSNAAAASGNVIPAGAVTSSDMNGPNQITLNAANGDLYVADSVGAKVLVFANVATLNGNVSATRNINGSNTQLGPGGLIGGPRRVALDPTR